MTRWILVLILLCVFASSDVESGNRPRLELEILGGAPINFSTPLAVRQDGFDELKFTGSYYSEPFTIPVYYAIRLSMTGEASAWAVELMHHKVFLENGPEEISDFNITHGFNIVTIQRRWWRSSWRWHAGVGIVVAHPESRVRGRRLDGGDSWLGGGYHLTGPAVMAGLSRRLEVSIRFFLTLEGRGIVAPVSVPVADGEASFTNVAFHAMFGVGGSF